MKLTTIVEEAAINFADCHPQGKEIMLDAFEKILEYENAVDGANPEDFNVLYASDEPTNTFGGAFITSIFGSYLLHDFKDVTRVSTEDFTECNIIFYSLSKIED